MKTIIYIGIFLFVIFCTKEGYTQTYTVTKQDSSVLNRKTQSKAKVRRATPIESTSRKKPKIKKGDLTYIYDPKLKRYILLEKPIDKKQ